MDVGKDKAVPVREKHGEAGPLQRVGDLCHLFLLGPVEQGAGTVDP